jgi:hypothetical protein
VSFAEHEGMHMNQIAEPVRPALNLPIITQIYPIVLNQVEWGYRPNSGDWGYYPIESVLYDQAHGLLFAGFKSHDTYRRNLVVYRIGRDGRTPLSPTWYRDHPTDLASSTTGSPSSAVSCLAFGGTTPTPRLYLGLTVTAQAGFSTPLIVHEVDKISGMPIGQPRAFGIATSSGAVIRCCGLALHPAARVLYAVGQSNPFSVSIVHLDELGMPTGSNTIANLPASGEFGPYAESGNLSVSVNSAGTLLCLGSNIAGEYLAVRLIRLDPHTGDIAIASGSQSAYWHSILLPGEGPIKLSDTPAATGKLTLAGNTAYYVSPKASLRSFTLPDLANPAPLAPADVAGFTEGIQTVSMTSHVGPVPLAETSIVVAVTDRLVNLGPAGPQQPNGTSLQKLPIDKATGSPQGAPAEFAYIPQQRITFVDASSATPAVVAGEPIAGAPAVPIQVEPFVAIQVQLLDLSPPDVAWAFLALPTSELLLLGEVSNGQVTNPFALDSYLADHSQWAWFSIWLYRTADKAAKLPVTSATLKITVYDRFQNLLTPTVITIPSEGSYAVLAIPGYNGLDYNGTPTLPLDPSQWHVLSTGLAGSQQWNGRVFGDPDEWRKLVSGVAALYNLSLGWAEVAASAVSGLPSGAVTSPSRTIVSTQLVVPDASPRTLEAGLSAIARLGINAIEVSQSFALDQGGIATDKMRRAALNHFSRFRHADQDFPGNEFDDRVLNPDSYIVSLTKKIQDEAGLPLPHTFDTGLLCFLLWTDETASSYLDAADIIEKKGLPVFQPYLKSVAAQAASTPELFFGNAELHTPKLTAIQTGASITERRLFYWTIRFLSHTFTVAQSKLTAALGKAFARQLLAGPYMNRAGSLPLSLWKLGVSKEGDLPNYLVTPDPFDIGRQARAAFPLLGRAFPATECLLIEDNISELQTPLSSVFAAFLRSAARPEARPGATAFGAMIMCNAIGVPGGLLPDGCTFKMMAYAGRGAAAFDIYKFGDWTQYYDVQNNWCNRRIAYEPIARAVHFLGRAEQLFGAIGQARAGTIALLWPRASQLWPSDKQPPYPEISHYQMELQGLHAALTHCQYPVDFVDDQDLEDGALQTYSYAVLYVTGSHLSATARQKTLDWVRSGGTLVLMPGAAYLDEYNDPVKASLSAASADFYVESGTQPFEIAHELVITETKYVTPPTRIVGTPQTAFPRLMDTSYPWYPLQKRVSLPSPEVTELAVLQGNSSAIMCLLRERVGGINGGRILSFGFWPGITYWSSPDVPLDTGAMKHAPTFGRPQGWYATARAVAALPALLAKAGKHVELTVEGIEALLLEAPGAVMVTVLPWIVPLAQNLPITINKAQAIPVGTPLHAISVNLGALTATLSSKGAIEVSLPRIDTVDVIVVRWSL